MPLREALMFVFAYALTSQRGAAPVVSLLCHVGKLGPREGIGQSPLRENKTAVLCVLIHDLFAMALCPTFRS